MIDGPRYRAELIAAGLLVTREARQAAREKTRAVLPMDDRGRREATRSIKRGNYGKDTLHVGPEYWRLAPWHLAAIERREQMDLRLRQALLRHALETGAFV